MESLDILILGVEAAIALAGFAGIIATFQFSGANEIRRADAIGLTVILQFSLLAAFLSTIPLLLHSFAVPQATLWAICSMLVVIVMTWALFSLSNSQRGIVKTKYVVGVMLVMVSACFVFILINVMNASGIFFHREAGPVIASIVWALILASFMFSRLLLRPIWRNVRSQEAANLADATSG